MRLQTPRVVLLAAVVLASGCANTDTRYGGNVVRSASVYSNDNMYAVIDAIETVPHDSDDKPVVGAKHVDTYSIRVRFDDRSYRTVTQASLDHLRVGDSVRIEGDRVRRY